MQLFTDVINYIGLILRTIRVTITWAFILLAGYILWATDPMYIALGCSRTTTCVVTENRGGTIGLFLWAAWSARLHERTVVIDGRCASACAVFADKTRPYVCITNRAQFQFHQGTNMLNGDRTEPSGFIHSHDLVQWVNDNHEFLGWDDLLTMPYSEARQFWSTCDETTAGL